MIQAAALWVKKVDGQKVAIFRQTLQMSDGIPADS